MSPLPELCFATNNQHKIAEVQQMLEDTFTLKGLKDFGITEELPETQDTLEGNSQQKAEFVFSKYRVPVFADDTGLEVTALQGAPGVYSARYAGPQRDSQDNMAKVLAGLVEAQDRSAQFRTVITLFQPNGTMHQFEGIAKGTLLHEPVGTEGFGYDPIFVPEGYDKTFAEMSSTEKNHLSHRGKAVQSLVDFLHSTKW